MSRRFDPDRPLSERQKQRQHARDKEVEWDSFEDDTYDPRHKVQWKRGDTDSDDFYGRNKGDSRGGKGRFRRRVSDHVTAALSRSKLMLQALFDSRSAYWSDDDAVAQQSAEGLSVRKVYDSERARFASGKRGMGKGKVKDRQESSTETDSDGGLFAENDSQSDHSDGEAPRQRPLSEKVNVEKTKRFDLESVRGRFGHLAGLNVEVVISPNCRFWPLLEIAFASSAATPTAASDNERANRGALPRRAGAGAAGRKNHDNSPPKNLRINLYSKAAVSIAVEDISSASETKRGVTRLVFTTRTSELYTLAYHHQGLSNDTTNERVDTGKRMELVYESEDVWNVVDGDFGKGGDNRVRAIEAERQDEVRRAERTRAGRRR